MNTNTAPQHSRLPWQVTGDPEFDESGHYMRGITIASDCGNMLFTGCEWQNVDEVENNARLITASVNAIGAMAAHLGCNPVELAERMANGWRQWNLRAMRTWDILECEGLFLGLEKPSPA